MSDRSLIAKVEFILEMVENIERIIKRHGGVVKAISDFEGQMALLMGLAQIGETLRKIDNGILSEHDLLQDKEGAYYTRNYIVHDYEGVDPAYNRKYFKRLSA